MSMSHTRGALSQNRGMMGFSLIAVLLLLMEPIYIKAQEEFTPRPWITAEVQIIPSSSSGEKPFIRYAPVAIDDFRGTWSAWPYDPALDKRYIGGTGQGSYSPDAPKNTLWTWDAYFEARVPEPMVPYQICVQYDGALPSGAKGVFGPFCSQTYDPITKRSEGE